MAALLTAHGLALRRVARRFSLCEDDAEDALQRSLEIYVRRLGSIERATETAWLKVVIRNEALAIRRTRAQSLTRELVDLDARPDGELRALDERLAARERSARSAEALRGLKRDEALALLLKAEGHSYREIAESQGWTYTKVNRAITEGRARFLKGFRAIEQGEACERIAPVLGALAAGSATAAQLREARPHLRHCASCRAALRALHAPLRRRVAALLPLGGLVAPAQWARARLGESGSERTAGLHRLRIRNVEDAGGSLPDGLGRADRVVRLPVPRPRGALQGLLQRIAGSDLATSVQLATGSGGGRAAALAALIGVCVSSVGAGGYCVATALLPAARPPARHAQRIASAATPPRARVARPSPSVLPQVTPRTVALVTAAPAATRSPRREATSATRPASSRSSRAVAPREFSFEASSGSSGATPASTPAATVKAASAQPRPSGAAGSGAGGSSAAGSGAAAARAGGEFQP